MPRGLGWQKLALVLVVFGTHLLLLSGFSYNFASGKSVTRYSSNIDKFSVLLRSATNKPSVDAAVKDEVQTDGQGSRAEATPNSVENQSVSSPGTFFWPNSRGSDYFLDSDLVDTPASPDDSFESLLAQLLPMNVQSVVLEFWIENDGRTIEVKCIEGACTDEVMASLPNLAELTFTPAFKNGEAVANRKVIQIDIKPNFGL